MAIPKASGQYAESKNRPVSKNTVVKEMGYSKDESYDYQQMAKHPETVEVYQRILREKAKENAKASGENFGRGMNEAALENSPKPVEKINTRKETAEAAPDRDPLVTS